ncbi:MAG TPA: creatininase family protein [Clostridia bacterium]|nr:creatininase family protein [Clostridia bacterium]
MQVRWDHLTPPEFKALVRNEKLCIVPMGSLERHGEHMPYGTDALVAHAIAVGAAEMEPCVVFPPYWFGQVHEASCFTGAINFPTRLLLEMLEVLLDQISHNGFTKILILNGHGGNTDFLRYFAMSQLDREVPYTLYIGNAGSGERMKEVSKQWETDGGHADESETSTVMAILPGLVKMEYHKFEEPILPNRDISHLKAHTGLWWYAMYPEQVTGCPSKATREKGERVFEAAKADVADLIRSIKDDTIVPEMQQEFYRRVREVRDAE